MIAASGPTSGGMARPSARKCSRVASLPATPSAFSAVTRRARGSKTSAWVSPPQESTSHIVAVAASIAQAASTALPPRWKVSAPAVAARGFPVIAIQRWPWSGGLLVSAASGAASPAQTQTAASQHRARATQITFCSRSAAMRSQS